MAVEPSQALPQPCPFLDIWSFRPALGVASPVLKLRLVASCCVCGFRVGHLLVPGHGTPEEPCIGVDVSMWREDLGRGGLGPGHVSICTWMDKEMRMDGGDGCMTGGTVTGPYSACMCTEYVLYVHFVVVVGQTI